MKVGKKGQLVRFAFAHVFEARKMDENSEAKYEVMVLIDKKHADVIAEVKKEIAAAKEKGKSANWGGKIPGNLRTPVKDGDSEEFEHLNLKGYFFFTARSKRKPGVVDRAKSVLEDDEQFYSGCYGLVTVDFFPYKHKTGGPGVSCGLNNIMKVEDGERMAGAPSAEADFENDFEDLDEDF